MFCRTHVRKHVEVSGVVEGGVVVPVDASGMVIGVKPLHPI
jgi:hypothetical protein